MTWTDGGPTVSESAASPETFVHLTKFVNNVARVTTLALFAEPSPEDLPAVQMLHYFQAVVQF